MPRKLIVVTVNYCCAEEILDRLDTTLDRISEFGTGEYWIVDNCSPDGSIEKLRQEIDNHPRRQMVRLIAAERNGGFGYGNNVAIRAALRDAEPPDYIYFLNPDATPAPGALKSLYDFLEAHPRAGIAGSSLRDEHGTIQTSMFRFPSFISEIEAAIEFGPVRKLLRRFLVPVATPENPAPFDWVTGASFMARSRIFEVAGVFDEAFFLYWEETELCYRVRAAGFEIWGVPDAIVVHVGGVTTGVNETAYRIPPYWFASRNHFFRATGIVRNVRLLNLVVVFCLAFRSLHLTLRRKPLKNPHFVRDFIRFSFLPAKKARLNRL